MCILLENSLEKVYFFNEKSLEKVKAAGYDLFIEPNDRDIPSDPVYPIRMAFCYGPLGEQVEFYMER